jgi:hypothetical protein
MQDPTKAIAEAYTKQVLFEQWASSKQNDIVEAISLFEEENGVELTEEQIKFVVESFLTESYQ